VYFDVLVYYRFILCTALNFSCSRELEHSATMERLQAELRPVFSLAHFNCSHGLLTVSKLQSRPVRNLASLDEFCINWHVLVFW
jgi:hypothetical protein